MEALTQNGILIFSLAGPHVARLLEEGERNPNAEVSEDNFGQFFQSYHTDGFAYSNHKQLSDREWGRSIISHDRLIRFLHEMNLETVMLSERLYANRQDVVAVRKKR